MCLRNGIKDGGKKRDGDNKREGVKGGTKNCQLEVEKRKKKEGRTTTTLLEDRCVCSNLRASVHIGEGTRGLAGARIMHNNSTCT